MDYRFVSGDQVPSFPEQLAALSNIAFADYEGAPEVDAGFAAWYLRRPGSGPEACVGALWGERLVSVVLVALQELNLGGEYVRCGIIDTVATHPRHRQRGLARQLMALAHDRIRAAGGEAAVLYTNPEGHPYRFYGRLGYLTRAQASLLTGPRPAPARRYTVRVALGEETGTVRDLVNAAYGGYEGYARLDEALWDWHRVRRPGNMPVTVLVAESAGRTVGAAALAHARVLLEGSHRQLCFVSDAAYPDRACLQDLLAASPLPDLAALYATDAPQTPDLEALGLAGRLGEVSMVMPFTERAGVLLNRRPAPWYVMAESVVGV
jgi:ribosomal protein S18 acetylase RimI-like enzyme